MFLATEAGCRLIRENTFLSWIFDLASTPNELRTPVLQGARSWDHLSFEFRIRPPDELKENVFILEILRVKLDRIVRNGNLPPDPR
jgi:hypothetical protein